MRILLVEDSEDDAVLLEMQLRREWPDAELQRVDSAADLDAALAHPWDVLISDYSLPSLSALDVLRAVRERAPDLPAIVVSGSIDEERSTEALRAGARDFLSKGRWARLVPAIKRELADAARRRQQRETERRLAEASERSEFAMRAAGVGVWERDLVANTAVWSPTMEEMHGLEPGQFEGSLDSFLAIVHPDDRPKVIETLSEEHRDGDEFTMRYRVPRPRRAPQWIVRRGRVYRPSNGRAARAVGIAMDVTEQHELEERLNHAQKMESVGNLAGGIAHDFNNLLTVISGYGELLAERFGDDAQALADLREVMHAAESATAMTRRLLAFSRRQVLAPRVVEINDVVMNLRSMLARLIEANVSLDFSLTPADTSVRIDPTQIEQILVNLVVNARDALPEGGRIVVGTSTASADSEAVRRLAELGDADHVVLVVSDTGTGIPPEVRERIFEPFFTTKEAGRGTGLGLSTVYGIVRQSQGTIDLESAPGEGTSFAIYLPQVRGDGSDDRAEPARTPVNVSGLRVLLVDDDTALRRFSERALTELGCVTGAADSVADGRRLVEAAPQPFDVALIDVMMPDAGGPALGAWLNAHRPSTRVIYTSGYPSESVASAGLPLGSAFLQKPFTKATLLATLSEARGGGR